MKRFLLFLLLLPVAFALPQPIGYVNDFANIIEPEWEEQLNALIGEIEKNTTVEIAIVTVKTLEDNTPEGLALAYLEQWGVGKKGTDNGLVILVALEEHKWRIEVGYGLEGTITDSISGRIGRHELVPYFKQGNYGEGLYNEVYVAPLRDWIGVIVFFYVWCLFFFMGFIEIIPNKKVRKGVGYTAFGIGFLASWLAVPLSFAFAMAGFTVFFLIAFLLTETRRPSHLPRGTQIWWGGSRGFGGIGGSSGGFGGFGGGGGGGGGAGGGW
jgi:uncharacterized protein